MSRTKTEKERAQKKARKKAQRKEQKNTKRIDVTKLVAMLDETMKLNQHLLKVGSEREKAISVVLEEHEKRIEALEQELGIQHDEESKEGSDQQRSNPGESPGPDNAGSGDEDGGVPVPALRAPGEDLPEAPALGDGAVPDQAGEEVPAASEVVLDEGAGPLDNEG